jgi:hypothetical protein
MPGCYVAVVTAVFSPGRLLVVGSFPPVLGPPSDATVAVVRRAWASGADVVTAAPRAAGADLVARVYGPLAGARLEAVRRAAGTPGGLVLGLQDGIPLLPSRRQTSSEVAAGGTLAVGPSGVTGWRRGADRLVALATIRSLARVLGRFESVTLLLSGPTGLSPADARPLVARADHVLVTAAGEAEARRLGVPSALVQNLEVSSATVAAPGVTPYGPPEVALRDRPLWVLGVVARRVLGRRFPYYRVHTIETARKVRRLVRRTLRRYPRLDSSARRLLRRE